MSPAAALELQMSYMFAAVNNVDAVAERVMRSAKPIMIRETQPTAVHAHIMDRPFRVPCRRRGVCAGAGPMSRYSAARLRSEEHTSELQSLMRISYAVFCLKK